MKKIIFALLIFNLTFAQEKSGKISRRIQLQESFSIPGFKVPSKVLVYSGGNFDLATNYNNLFKKIEKRANKPKDDFKYLYNVKADFPKNLKSFDELDIKFNNEKYDAICILLLGEVQMSEPDKTSDGIHMYYSKSPEYYYDFYVLMVEANTHKILLKRKYNVRSMDLFNKDSKELAKAISKIFTD
ncbi:hypothetical protein [uncultured Winogradskyella sp.]|uniref:hypothetical protein n=1 Tax=uncultured Winogradskyella sp. TaxID=395353 RepID=UPI0026261132|nr:hypothetical protein [uncultured Winogradskyella sp.]